MYAKTSSRSTVYVGVFVLFWVGLGIWGYWHKTVTDRELKAKADWQRIQNGYAGHNSNTIPPAGAPTPLPRMGSLNDEQMKRLNEETEKFKAGMKPQPMPSISVPTPLRRPDL
jgi:hypothetical protein